MFNTDEYQFDCYDKSRTRIQESGLWSFSYSIFISLFLAITIVTQLGMKLNFKRGHLVETTSLNAEEPVHESVWLSIDARDGKVFVKTFDQKNFEFDESQPSQEELDALEEYFQALVKHLSVSSVLEEKISDNRSFVTLALDNKVKYGHIKPILDILAKSGLSEYGFETRATFDE